jgi:hypothetical protein
MDDLTVQQITLILMVVMVALAIITAIISLILETDRTRQWYGDWFQGVSTEMVGAIVTTILFTFILGAVQEQQAQTELKKELITQLGSTVNSEAVRAAERLAENDWIRDGSLRDVDLSFADLSGALLFVADMEGATMFSAILQRADLSSANLQDAFLQGVDFQEAVLEAVNFQSAVLEEANFRDANLKAANFSGASLLSANLEDADLANAQFDANTILPDGMNWTADTDMARFTDSAHPDFWRPEPNAEGALPWWMSS